MNAFIQNVIFINQLRVSNLTTVAGTEYRVIYLTNYSPALPIPTVVQYNKYFVVIYIIDYFDSSSIVWFHNFFYRFNRNKRYVVEIKDML